MLRSLARRGLESLLARADYRMMPANEPPRGFEAFLALYNRYAPAPPTVIDVGVGPGTPWLYAGFPAARLVLVEPLREFSGAIERILAGRNGIWHACALAEADGEMAINVSAAQPTGSSLLARTSGLDTVFSGRGDRITERRTVKLRRLDGLLAGETGPFVLKIDVEGAELQVLGGADGVLAATDLVVVECSVIQRHVGQSDVIDIAQFLKARGFALADVLTLESTGPDRRLAYLDAAFVRSGSPLLRLEA